jgi:hypothetical protein
VTPSTQQPGSQPVAPAADGARWRGHTHKELYLLLHDGPGAAASAEPSRRWAEISTALGEIGQDLQKALEQSGASWSGKAAGAAYDRLSVTAAWATDTGVDAAGMRTAVETQADNIARARADMPPPEDMPATQPDPTVAPVVQIVKAQTDLEGAEAAASSAEERAFEVMAAYELNTNTTTGTLSTFEAPPALDHRDEIHQGQEVGTQHTHASSAGLLGGLLGGGHHGHGGHHGGWPGTNSSSAPWAEPEVRGPSYGSGRGGFSGVLDPLLFGSGDRSGRGGSRSSQFSYGGSSGGGGGGMGVGTGGVPGGSGSEGGAHGVPGSGSSSSPMAGGSASGAVPKTGPTAMGGMPPNDMQAAAAGHAAAVHQASAGPMAPAAGVGGAGAAQDRMALRRFGMDAIGSNQWFGEADEAVVGEAPRRRRDFRETEQVIESVSILGEEHKLPPTAIGDGPTER